MVGKHKKELKPKPRQRYETHSSHAARGLVPPAAPRGRSCTDTLVGRPDTDDRTITFQTPQADTRAAVTGTSLTSCSFLVWGWYDDGATNVFDAETVTGDNGVWTYEGTRYWKAGETYNFYAVYPAELPADADADVSLKVPSPSPASTAPQRAMLLWT